MLRPFQCSVFTSTTMCTMICAVTMDISPKPAVQTQEFDTLFNIQTESNQKCHIRCYFSQITNYTRCALYLMLHYTFRKSHYTLQIPQVTLHGGGHIGNQRKARAGRVLHGSPATKSNPAPPPLISTTRLTPNHLLLHLFLSQLGSEEGNAGAGEPFG